MSKTVTRGIAALLLAAGAGQLTGCRACQSCNDYSAPVANCEACGAGRAGSVYGAPVGPGEAVVTPSMPQPPSPQQTAPQPRQQAPQQLTPQQPNGAYQ